MEREKDVGWDGQTGITRERHMDRDREGRKEKQQDREGDRQVERDRQTDRDTERGGLARTD